MPGCVGHMPDGLAGCDRCRAVWRDYDRRRRARIADGTWLPKVDVSVVQQHVAGLRAAGMTIRRIAAAAGVDRETLQRLSRRQWMTGATAAAILAVTAPEPEAPSPDVDEVAVERALAGERLPLNDDELVAALQMGTARGEALSSLSARLHINHMAAKRLLNGEQTSVQTRRAVITEALRADPRRSNRAIAAELDVGEEVVRRVRRRLAKKQSPIAS